MPPVVSVIIPTDRARPEQLRAIFAQLRAQAHTAWEAILTGTLPSPEPGFDPRIRTVKATGSRAGLLNRALESCSSPLLMVAEPEDQLLPGAFGALVRAAGQDGFAGAIGDYSAECRIGHIPGDRLPTGPELGWDELIACGVPLCAVMFNRRSLGSMRFDDAAGAACQLDFMLQLAERGARWARVADQVAVFRMRALLETEDALAVLLPRIRVVAESCHRRGLPEHSATADLIDALILLRSHERAIRDSGTGHLQAAVRFPASFPQWWQRLGFNGPAPRHILAANGGHSEAITQLPERIAARMVESCPPGRVPVLLGFGKNARVVARRLHAFGIPVRGRDDSLSAPPAWSGEDNIPVELLPRDAEFDRAAPHLMTVLNDAGFLARLPAGLHIIRWAAMPGQILAEQRTLALAEVMSTSSILTGQVHEAVAGAGA